MYTTIQPTQQLQLPIGVKEEILPQPRKRVAIVSVKLVQEALQLTYRGVMGCSLYASRLFNSVVNPSNPRTSTSL